MLRLNTAFNGLLIASSVAVCFFPEPVLAGKARANIMAKDEDLVALLTKSDVGGVFSSPSIGIAGASCWGSPLDQGN